MAQADTEWFLKSTEEKLKPSRRSERRWTDLLKAILCRHPDRRPGITEVEDRLSAMGAAREPRIPAPTVWSAEHLSAAVCEPVRQTSVSQRLAFYFVLTGGALVASGLAGLILSGKGCRAPDPQAPMNAPDKVPDAPQRLQLLKADHILSSLNKGTLRAHGMAVPHQAYAIELTTEELITLLEEGQPGISRGLPNRKSYPAYIYTLRPGTPQETRLLSMTRGGYFRKGGQTTFHPIPEKAARIADQDLREFIAAWTPLDDARANRDLQELKKAAGVK